MIEPGHRSLDRFDRRRFWRWERRNMMTPSPSARAAAILP